MLRRYTRNYARLMRVSWAISMEYRAQALIWMLGTLLVFIMMLVWLSISKNGPVGGYSADDFVTYYMVGLVVRQLTAVWSSWELDAAIREGRLSPLLLRPIHPIHNEIAANWGEKGLRMIILLPIVAVVLLVVPHTPIQSSPLNVLAFLVSIFGAWQICFAADYLIGMLAFWTSQSTAFVQMFFALRMMLSGVLAPVALLPQVIQPALHWLPFRYMLSFCNEIALGRLSTSEILSGLAIQFAWGICLWLAVRGVWKIAMRSYSAVGA